MLGFFNISFANPLWFLLFPFLAGILYLAYRLKTKPVVQRVASLFLLKKLSSSIVVPKNVKLPPLFWLELLTLLLLVLILATPYYDNAKKDLIVIVDNSFSMSQQLLSAEQKKTLLQIASENAKSLIDKKSSDYNVDIFKTSAKCESILQNDQSASYGKLLSALSGIKISFSEDKLISCIERVRARSPRAEIEIFTDQILKLSDGSSKVRVNTIATQSSAINFAIKDVNLAYAGADRISVKLQRFGAEQQQAFNLLVYSYDQNWKRTLIAEQPVAPTKLTELLFHFPISKSVRAIYATISFSSRLVEDAFQLDNHAWWLRSKLEKSIDVALISNRNLRALGVRELSNVHVYTEVEFAEGKADSYKALIFDKIIPKTLPKVSSLFVLPPKNPNFPFSALELVAKTKIFTKTPGHELLKYLDLTLWSEFDAMNISGPAWSSTVASSFSGNLILAGVLDGQRYAALGFDLFPYEGGNNLISSVLFHNLTNWLGFSDKTVKDPVNINSNQVSLEPIDYLPLGSAAGSYENSPGLWRSVDNSELVVLRSFFSAKESDPKRLEQLYYENDGLSKAFNEQEHSASASNLIFKIITLLLLLILFAERIFLRLRNN